MQCDGCSSERIIHLSAKCSDMCTITFGEWEKNGYVPNGINIQQDSEDFVEFYYCAECGKVQGEFPLTDDQIEEALMGDTSGG